MHPLSRLVHPWPQLLLRFFVFYRFFAFLSLLPKSFRPLFRYFFAFHPLTPSSFRPRATSPPLSAFLCGFTVLLRFTSPFFPSSFVVQFFSFSHVVPFWFFFAFRFTFGSLSFYPVSDSSRHLRWNAPLLLGLQHNYRVLRFASGLPRWCRAYRWSPQHRDPRNGFLCFILPLCRPPPLVYLASVIKATSSFLFEKWRAFLISWFLNARWQFVGFALEETLYFISVIFNRCAVRIYEICDISRLIIY